MLKSFTSQNFSELLANLEVAQAEYRKTMDEFTKAETVYKLRARKKQLMSDYVSLNSKFIKKMMDAGDRNKVVLDFGKKADPMLAEMAKIDQLLNGEVTPEIQKSREEVLANVGNLSNLFNKVTELTKEVKAATEAPAT